MACVLGAEVIVTVEENGKAHYKIQPKKTVVFDQSSQNISKDTINEGIKTVQHLPAPVSRLKSDGKPRRPTR